MTQPKDVRRRAGITAELIVDAATRPSEGAGLDSWTQRDLAGDSAGSGGERDIIEDTPVLEASRDLRDRDRCSRIGCEGRV